MVFLALHKVYGVDRPDGFSTRLLQAEILRDPFPEQEPVDHD
jgi:hypothetical protein